MICGKGGSGKSTITALLARHAASKGRRVLVIDTDVSNEGLHRILGVEAPPDFTAHFGARHGRRRSSLKAPAPRMHNDPLALAEKPPHPPTPAPGTWTYDKLPEGFVSQEGTLKMIAIGKIKEADQFGKGFWTGLAVRFMKGLQLETEELVLIDVEAGLEHIDRGIGRVCDLILFVVEPSFDSIRLASTVVDLVKEDGVPLRFVLNKTDLESSALIRESLKDHSLILAELQREPALIARGLAGKPAEAGHPVAIQLLEKVSAVLA